MVARCGKTAWRTYLVVALTVAALALVIPSQSMAQAQTVPLPSFVTVGVGYVVVEADRVVVSLGIEATGDSAVAAQQENGRRAAAIEEAVTALGIDGLEFDRRLVDVRQQRTGVVRRDEGDYRAVSGVEVTVPDEQYIGAIIDAAVAAGNATVQAVRFHSTALEEASKEALRLAVKDAMAKAEAMSEATGMRVVMTRRVSDAHKIDIINPSDPLLLEGGTARPPYPVPVKRGEILVQVEVSAEFEVGIR